MMLTRALTAMGIVLSILDTSPLVTAIPTKPVLQAPLNGYSVFDVTWQIVVDPKNAPGVTTNFTGTVQEVMAQAVALNPNFMSDYDLDPSKLTPPGAGDPGVVDSDLEQDAEHLATVSENNGTLSALMGRYTIKDHVCFPKKWTACRVDTIDDGIYYLEKKAQGIPGEGPGPASCGRVSCSYNAAIWWCNDNDHFFQLDSYQAIADGAQYIAKNCYKWLGGERDRHAYTCGQVFYQENWNVIVRYDDVDC